MRAGLHRGGKHAIGGVPWALSDRLYVWMFVHFEYLCDIRQREMDKVDIRRAMRDISRREQDSEHVHETGPGQTPGQGYADLWQQVEEFEAFIQAKTVLIYMALPDEVPTSEFIAKWRTVKRLAIPLVNGDHLLLKEHNPRHLVRGYRGILEPTDDALAIHPSEIDFAIIPGVAFDPSGNRLGRGKGFYDRLLPSLDCFKVGVCQSWRIVPSLPTDLWDVPMDAVCVAG